MELNGLLVGLGIVTMTLFPIALPGLLLALPLALPLVPLALVAVVGYLVVRILLLPVRLARTVLRHRRGRGAVASPGTGAAAVPPGAEIRAIGARE